MTSFNFEAIGTTWSIDLQDHLSTSKEQDLKNKIFERVEVFDKTYSRFRSDSLITKISQKAGEYTFPEDAKALFAMYKKLYQQTNGAFTPLIGNVLSDAGYDAHYSLQPHTLHHPPPWEDVLEYTHPKLKVKKPAILDFGAAGKGYLVDIIGKILEQHGIRNFCVDGSGDILYKNTQHKAIRIGLEHPSDPKQVIGVVELTDGSICGSAGNRRAWGDYHHIISPHTLTSPTNIIAVWVTADTAMLADALTTCLFFVPASQMQKYYRFEYVIVNQDYSLQKSQDFPGEFFYN